MLILLPASMIPLGSTVIKRTGTKRHLLKDRLRLFDGNGNQKALNAEPGTLFLVCDGDANAIAIDTEIFWDIPRYIKDDIIQIMEQHEEM